MAEKAVTDEKLAQIAAKQWELFRQVREGALDAGLVADELQRIIEGEGFRQPEDLVSLFADWQVLYKDVFEIEVDFSGLSIPNHRKGFDRLIIIAKGMTFERLFYECKELFPCWKWIDKSFDDIIQSERTSKDSPYAVWFRNRVEADEELKNRAAHDLKVQDIPCITLEERLLMELKYFKETGEHLDRENITLCAGSRYSNGSVPSVSWRDGGLYIGWCDPGLRVGGLLARRAILAP